MGSAPLNQLHVQRENLGVEQTKGGNQCHAERKNWLSRSSPSFFHERVKAGQPPGLAEVAYGGHVGVGVAAEEFYDVRTRLRASGGELERSKVWQRQNREYRRPPPQPE